MAESAAGIVLAAIAIIEPLIQLGRGVQKSTHNALNFGKDAERFRVTFNHERRRLEAIRKVLLEKEFGPEDPSTLFEQFQDDWQADLFDELRQLRILYLEMESMESRYQIFAPMHSSLAGALPTDAIVDLSVNDRREFRLQNTASRKQLAFWALRDSKRTQELISRLETWVNRFRETVAMSVGYFLLITTYANVGRYLWAYFSNRKQLQQLQDDGDAQALELANAARLRQIILDHVQPGEMLVIKPSDVSHQTNLGQLSGRLYGAQFKHTSVLMEHKEYDRDAEPAVSQQTTERVGQLAAILHQQNSRSLHVLQCHGYFVDAAHARYTFVFKVSWSCPKSFELSLNTNMLMSPGQLPEGVQNSPISLLSAISEKDAFKSTLKHRLQLAYTLAETLYHLHLVGWVHKSLRSENVLLFPKDSSESSQSLDSMDTMINRSTKLLYAVPWVVGFEYARVVSGDSDLTNSDGIKRNMYRHPERWNSPTHRFSRIHDIYALGTILLEIGLWRPLAKLSENGFSRAEDADNSAAGQAMKNAVKTQLLHHAEKLPFSLGRNFRDAVVACLKGNATDGFGVDPSDNEGLQKAFRAKVIDPLSRILASI